MTEQHSSSPATSTSGTVVEQEQPNQRNDDNSNPQQGASSRNSSNYNNNECPPTSVNPEQDLTALNNVSTHTLGHPDESNKTGNGSFTNPPAPRQSLKIPPSQKDERKLFVGGLPADITDEEFRLFFEQFGEVIDSIVMIDYETNRSRGFGFVTFQDPNVSRYLLSRGHDNDSNIPPELQEQARKSMSGRMQMRDKWIEIKAAEPKAGSGGVALGGRGRYGSGAPSRGGAAAGRSRNAINPAFSMRNQHGNYEHRNAPFIPPHPAGQALMNVGDPYNTPEYGAVPPATLYQHGTTNQPQPPQYPQYYGQHPAPHAGVYAHPYYYPAPVMYTHHHAAGFGDPAAVIPDVDPSLTAVPMVHDMEGADAITPHPDVYPVNFGYSYAPHMPTANSSYGVTIVPVPLPHPSPMPVIHQQSVMQPVAPGIPGQSSSLSKDENDSTNA